MSLVESIDQYKYPDDAAMHQSTISKFLWFCAGADMQLLKHCPQSERIKEEGIGGVVLATGVLAFLSSSYAFYRVFNPGSSEGTPVVAIISSIAFGLIWSLIIFNLDRFIVSSSGHGDGTEKITLDEFIGAIPRLLMALIIGFTLSKPLEIRVMQSELDAILKTKQMEYKYGRKDANGQQMTVDEKGVLVKPGAYDSEKIRWDSEKSKLKDVEFKELTDGEEAINAKIKDYREKEDKFTNEKYTQAGGKNGYAAGRGTGYKDAEANADKYAKLKDEETANLEKYKQYHQSDYDQKAKREADVIKTHDEKIKEIEDTADHMGGLVNRIMWAHEAFPIVSWALTLLLLAIEVAPILYKLMIRNGPYHYLTENQREIVAARYAVERKANALAGNNGQQAEIEIFHQAEASLKSSIAHLTSEGRLSQQALDKFEGIVSRDIDNNPDKYVKIDPPSRGA